MDLLSRCRELALPLGFGDIGVCPFAPLQPHLLAVRSRGRLPDDAAYVIVLLAGYYVGEANESNLARYAWIDDYHEVLLPRLRTLCGFLEKQYNTSQFIPFVDSSPIPEIMAASLAGLGEPGKNGLLFHPLYQNACFICEIVTNAPLGINFDCKADKLCTGCGRCIAACPTGALTENGLNPDKCRSQLTQKKGVLTHWEEAQICVGGMAWGCDICMQACPLNKSAAITAVDDFRSHVAPMLTKENLDALLRRKAYGWRGRAVLERNLALLAEKAD